MRQVGVLGAEQLEIFTVDPESVGSGLRLVGEGQRLSIPRGRRGSYTDLVYDLCERHRIDVLIPTVDRELVLLASARVFFAEVGTKMVLASEETLRTCLDKWVLYSHCKGVVRVPDCLLADEDFDPAGPILPVVVKPRIGGGLGGVEVIERHEELERIDREASLLVQEHLPGAKYSLDVFASSDGRAISVVPRAQTQADPDSGANGGGVSGQDLEVIARRVAKRIELTSVANIVVKGTSEGELALLDVRPHFVSANDDSSRIGFGIPIP
jgi:carbamoyl-phosphate synthase large subunit